MLAEGDPAAAAQIYAEILGFDATNIAALAGLAKCYATTGAIEQAKQTLAMVPESKRNDAAVKAVQASIDLAEQAQAVGPVTELEQKVAANPLDHQARFDLATALNAQRQRARKRPTSCSKSSSAIASGTMTARASSWCSSSRRGAAPTKRPSRDESGCRRSCSRRGVFPPNQRTDRDCRCRSMPNTADPASFPKSFRCFRCRARCCCRAARCRSIFSSRAIWRWWTTRCATVTG